MVECILPADLERPSSCLLDMPNVETRDPRSQKTVFLLSFCTRTRLLYMYLSRVFPSCALSDGRNCSERPNPNLECPSCTLTEEHLPVKTNFGMFFLSRQLMSNSHTSPECCLKIVSLRKIMGPNPWWEYLGSPHHKAGKYVGSLKLEISTNSTVWDVIQQISTPNCRLAATYLQSPIIWHLKNMRHLHASKRWSLCLSSFIV